MAKKGKLFGDGELINNLLTTFTEYACPEKKHMVEQTSLSRFTVSRRANYLTDNIKETLRERLRSFAAFSLALDESTDICDIAHLVIFIRTVTVGLVVVEEFLDMTSLSFTATRHDICEHVIRVVEKFELCPDKLCGLTTYVDPLHNR